MKYVPIRMYVWLPFSIRKHQGRCNDTLGGYSFAQTIVTRKQCCSKEQFFENEGSTCIWIARKVIGKKCPSYYFTAISYSF